LPTAAGQTKRTAIGQRAETRRKPAVETDWRRPPTATTAATDAVGGVPAGGVCSSQRIELVQVPRGQSSLFCAECADAAATTG